MMNKSIILLVSALSLTSFGLSAQTTPKKAAVTVYNDDNTIASKTTTERDDNGKLTQVITTNYVYTDGKLASEKTYSKEYGEDGTTITTTTLETDTYDSATGNVKKKETEIKDINKGTLKLSYQSTESFEGNKHKKAATKYEYSDLGSLSTTSLYTYSFDPDTKKMQLDNCVVTTYVQKRDSNESMWDLETTYFFHYDPSGTLNQVQVSVNSLTDDSGKRYYIFNNDLTVKEVTGLKIDKDAQEKEESLILSLLSKTL
jgi:hypothetical protein